MLCLCGIAAAGVGGLRAGNVVDADHDAGVTRVLGLVPQPWRALDVVLGSLFAVVPAATRIARAEVGGALVLGVAAAALYELARRLLSHCAHAPRLAPVIAAIAALSAVPEAAWQREGATVGGTASEAALVIPTLALAVHALERPTRIPDLAEATGPSCAHAFRATSQAEHETLRSGQPRMRERSRRRIQRLPGWPSGRAIAEVHSNRVRGR
jgi:hypothetical protein